MKSIFNIIVITFITIGLLMVLGQIIGLLTFNSDIVVRSQEIFEGPAYLFSSLAAILGFILMYKKDKVTE